MKNLNSLLSAGRDSRLQVKLKNIVFLLPLISAVAFAQSPIPIFPDAVGHGRFTYSGSGRHSSPAQTTVYRVNTLSGGNAGPTEVGDGTFYSSFKTAYQASGPRVIIFEISGTIDIGATKLTTTNDYLTVAGQTAPSPGITIKGGTLNINANHVLISHLRTRHRGDVAGDNWDALASGGGNYHYIDHVTASWGNDETIQWWNTNSFVTIAWTIASEGLQHNLHPQGPHSAGMLFGGGTKNNISILYNLLAHNQRRNIRVASPGDFEIINNIVYDWASSSGGGAGGTMLVDGSTPDVIGNFYKRGPNSSGTKEINITGGFSGPAYIQGNVGPNSSTPTAFSDYSMVSGGNFDSHGSATPLTTRSNVTILNANDLMSVVLPNVGARPVDRDPVDTRIVNDVINGTGRIIDFPSDVGGFPNLAVNTVQHVLPANFNETMPSGYTALEEWLYAQKLAVEAGGSPPPPPPPVVSVSQPVTGPGLLNFNQPGNQPGTAVSIDITSVTGSGSITVSRFGDGPSNPAFSGTPPANISQYRWDITQSGLSSVSGEVRFDILEFGTGITNPNTVAICSRPTVGTGQFNELPTTYSSASNELRATVSGFSEFIFASNDNPLTEVGQEQTPPSDFTLAQNYPNPFNPSTVIEFALAEKSDVILDVYNVLGERVATLLDDSRPAGYYTVQFDAASLTSGIYFYRLKAGEFAKTRKLLLLR